MNSSIINFLINFLIYNFKFCMTAYLSTEQIELTLLRNLFCTVQSKNVIINLNVSINLIVF